MAKPSEHRGSAGSKAGPLTGLRVLEIEALGPVPAAAMLLSDMGADIVRIDRPRVVTAEDYNSSEHTNLVNRGRTAIRMNLKDQRGLQAFYAIAAKSDVLLEGYRPGVMEKLGIGPKELLERSPGLVYTRITGWGQDGPLAHTAGHDMNYIALSGALGSIGPSGAPPVPPLNILGDIAGGALLAVVGILAALHERQTSGRGQVVDTAIIDGSALVNAFVWGRYNARDWGPRGTNYLDGGAPYYAVYGTKDGRYVAFGAIEEKFFDEFVRLAGLDPRNFQDRRAPENWPAVREKIATYFGARTLAEIQKTFENSDACVTPVLSHEEALKHPHMQARGTMVNRFDLVQPAPAPRFSRTPSEIQGSPIAAPRGTVLATLREWGVQESVMRELTENSPENDV